MFNLRISEEKKVVAADPTDETAAARLARYESWAKDVTDDGIEPLQMEELVMKVVEGLEPGTVKRKGKDLDWSNKDDRDFLLSRPGITAAIWQTFCQEFLVRT